MINARAETVDTLNFYKKPFREQRCLIPASGFYEWKTEGKQKTKFYFHRKDTDLFAFAGLYSVWHSPDGKEIPSYTIITTTPNKTVKAVHDRMPVILKREDEDTWLNPDIQEPEHLKAFLVPYADSEIEAYPVASGVKKASDSVTKPNSE